MKRQNDGITERLKDKYPEGLNYGNKMQRNVIFPVGNKLFFLFELCLKTLSSLC